MRNPLHFYYTNTSRKLDTLYLGITLDPIEQSNNPEQCDLIHWEGVASYRNVIKEGECPVAATLRLEISHIVTAVGCYCEKNMREEEEQSTKNSMDF